MKLLFVSLVIALSFSAMASDRQEKDLAAVKALKSSIELLAKADLSCAEAADCALVAVGSRACGGPSGFVVTSRDNGNFDLIDDLAQKSQEKEAHYNKTYGVVSICSIVRPPVAVCKKKVCSYTAR